MTIGVALVSAAVTATVVPVTFVAGWNLLRGLV